MTKDREKNINQRLTELSPDKQALFKKRLRGEIPQDPRLEFSRLKKIKTGNYPLSFAQERMWFLNQYEPGCPAYNRPVAWYLSGPLDIKILQQTLNKIIERHAVLRSIYPSDMGKPVLKISPIQPDGLKIHDLRSISPKSKWKKLHYCLREESQHPFDLALGHPVRGTLYILNSEEHVLLLVMHHIVFDAWSSKILLEEFVTLYDRFSRGDTSPLPKLPIQYGDFAYWQRQQFKEQGLESQLNFWLQKLNAFPPSLNFPTDRPRPAVMTHNGSVCSFPLSPGLYQSLRTFSHQEHYTLFMTLLTGFAILLYRYSAQKDIVVGTPVAGRNHVEIEKLIGLIVNTLAFRINQSGESSVRSLLAQIRQTSLDGYVHQDLPFEKLVEHLKPHRDVSRTPIFQVLLNYENIPSNAVSIQNLCVQEFEFDDGIAQFDLSMEIQNKGNGLSGNLTYNTDLFDAETIKRIIKHYQNILENMVSKPDQPISTLSLLTPEEKHRILVQWNDTKNQYPDETCIHYQFEAQARQTPDSIAVVFQDQCLTYKELDRRTNQLARYLRKKNVGVKTTVTICMQRSLEMVIGLLGILKAGGAYVPIDPSYPEERIYFMINDTQSPVLLTQERLRPFLSDGNTKIICLDSEWNEISRESGESVSKNCGPENLAYVIYTSGSTGIPKGVMISHRSICNHMYWIQSLLKLIPSDRILQLTPFSFDASVWQFYVPLQVGAQLIMARPNAYFDGQEIIRQILDHQITTIHFMPSNLRVLLETKGIIQCKSLKHVICGGETLSIQLQELVFSKLSTKLYNLYGPTEATIDSTSWICKQGQDDQKVPIGRPINNTQIYILSLQKQPVPIGVQGEIYIGGVGLARGYLNQPELTSEKFVTNPFDEKPDSLMYRTGDLGRYRPDGNIEFLGRMDHQIKWLGYRIELGEIETLLAKHPSIHECAVILKKSPDGHKRLSAYFIPTCELSPSKESLRVHLRHKFPDYMVPSSFIPIETMPLNPNGKIDRQSLATIENMDQNIQDQHEPPRNPVEEIVIHIWIETLGLSKLGVHDNFFDCGGHSLIAAHVISRIRDVFKVELPIKSIFEKPTVSGLVSLILEDEKDRSRIKKIANFIIKMTNHDDQDFEKKLNDWA